MQVSLIDVTLFWTKNSGLETSRFSFKSISLAFISGAGEASPSTASFSVQSAMTLCFTSSVSPRIGSESRLRPLPNIPFSKRFFNRKKVLLAICGVFWVKTEEEILRMAAEMSFSSLSVTEKRFLTLSLSFEDKTGLPGELAFDITTGESVKQRRKELNINVRQ